MNIDENQVQLYSNVLIHLIVLNYPTWEQKMFIFI